MKLRDAFISGVAAAALAISLSQDAAAAEQQQPVPSGAALTEPAAQKNEQIVTTRSVKLNPVNPLGSKVPVDSDALIALIAALALVNTAVQFYASRRGVKGAWLRAAAGGAAALALLNPEIMQEEHKKLPTEVAIVVDKSASQSLGAREKTTAETQAVLADRLSRIPGVEVRIIEAGGKKDGVAVDGTNLFAAARAGTADIAPDRLGAVILLTDGQVHDIPSTPDSMSGAPVHALLAGGEGERDRRIVLESAPRFGLVNKTQTIRFRVVDEGATAGTDKVRVTVHSDGREISTRMVAPGETVEMTVDIPHNGSNIFELRADPLEGELTDVNNRVVAPIEGIRETLSVLLVSGAPNAGVRVWRDLLKSDPDNDLVHFTFLRTALKDPKAVDHELSLIPFPERELFMEKIDKFDLIIFDHYDNAAARLQDDYYNNIVEFVQNGGALLVLSGPEYAGQGSLHHTPLGAVLPAQPSGQSTEEPYTPRVTNTGKRHPVTRDLPGDGPRPGWGRWITMVGSAGAPPGQVIMEGAGGEPLLILNRVGEGRVGQLQSDSPWLWARGFEGGGPYAPLLRGASHWLMKNPALEEESLRMTMRDGKIVIEQQTLADRNAPVTVRTPSGKTEKITPQAAGPGLFRAELPADELGLYSAEQGGRHAARTFTNVGPANPKEFIHTVSTPDLLKPVVEGTGGRIGRMAGPAGESAAPQVQPRNEGETMAGADWIGIRMSNAQVLSGVSRTPLPHPALSLLLTVGLLAGAWYREGDGTLFRRRENKGPGGDSSAGRPPLNP